MVRDHYADLGVTPMSEDIVIRAAYLALMRRYHPDVNPSTYAAERIRIVTGAYEVLGDPDRRAEYDQMRAAKAQAAAPRPSAAKPFAVGPVAFGIFAMLLMLSVFLVWVQQPGPDEPLVASSEPRRASPAPERDVTFAAVQASDMAASARPDAAAVCTSGSTNMLLKQELFRRAAQIRGRDGAAFIRLAGSSFVRIGSPLATGFDQPQTVSCRAAVAVDLPPGVAAGTGQRTVAAELAYRVAVGAGANGMAVMLGNADRIAGPLATLAQIARPEDTLAAVVVDEPPAPAPAPAPPVARPAAAPAAAPPPAPAKPPAPARATATASVRAPEPKPAPKPAAKPAATPAASQSPASTNCRFAKQDWETALCSNSNLAALDRHLALFYNQSWRSADAAKRDRLTKSSYQFIGRRNACTTNTCVRNAYTERMKEVAGILSAPAAEPKAATPAAKPESSTKPAKPKS